MNIKNIEEAKKYIGKKVYTASDFNSGRGKNVVNELYIGGVNLFFNQVNYDVEGFYLWEDKKRTKAWGDVKLDKISDKWDSVERKSYYFFSKEEAEKYCEWLNRDELEKEKERELAYAKELLNKHNIKYEIFD